MPEYREYAEESLAEAERINGELGEDGWSPIEVRLREDYPGALAAYGLYDVLFVNPVIDGMNLVAMEGPLLNRHQGVLVLSRNAGAFGRLGRYAVRREPVRPRRDVRRAPDRRSRCRSTSARGGREACRGWCSRTLPLDGSVRSSTTSSARDGASELRAAAGPQAS